MNRLVLVVAGVAVAAIAVAIALVIGGGGGGDPEPAPRPAADVEPVPAPAVAEPAPETNAAALARFNAWAEPLRASGFTISAERVVSEGAATVVAGLSIAGPPDAISWRWTAPSVLVEAASGAGVTLRPTGTNTLSVTHDGVTTRSSLTTSALRLDLERDAAGRVNLLVVQLRDLTLQREDGTPPLTMAAGELRLGLADGEGLVPARSVATLRVEDLVLPAQAASALGTDVTTLTADIAFERSFAGWAIAQALDLWWAAEPGITLTNLRLEWGALDLVGAGFLTLDAAGRPAGRFQVEVVDPLTVLDAFHVRLRFGRDLLADVYAALLEEIGRDPAAPRVPFTIAIAGGNIVLLGEGRGVADLVLGPVGPLFAPAVP